MTRKVDSQDRETRVNEIIEQVYRFIQKKDVTLRELTRIVYGVKRIAESNSKV